MNVEKLIDDLDELVDASWRFPLSGGKVIVDSKEMRRLLEDVRLSLPREIIQAKNVVADRTKIIEDAKQEAQAIIKASEEKAGLMISQSEIVKNAQNVANRIISEAKIKSKEIKSAANVYVGELIKKTDKILTESVSEIRKARQSLNGQETSAI